MIIKNIYKKKGLLLFLFQCHIDLLDMPICCYGHLLHFQDWCCQWSDNMHFGPISFVIKVAVDSFNF